MAIGWKILSRIIPHGRAEEVAEEMDVSLDLVHRWMRMPLSSENPSATGRANPIDRVARLIKATHKINPDEAHQIVDGLLGFLAELEGGRDGPTLSDAEMEATLRARARELMRIANALAANRTKK